MNQLDRDIVTLIRARIAERIGRERYELWFGSLTELTLRGESLLVVVPNQFVQDWLRTNFRKDLEAACAEGAGRQLALEFEINGSAKQPERKPCTPPPAKVSVSRAPAASPSKTEGSILRSRSSLASFVVGRSNCLAHKAAQMAVDEPGHYSPLLVCGPSGCGKTHLLEGVVAAYRERRPRAAAVYLSAEQFTSDFLEALRGSGLPSFRRKYRALELMAIDDLQFFVNKRATQMELLHTLDYLVRGGRQLIFAADRPAGALKSLGPELVARLAGSVVCPIDPAEFATRLEIVRQLAGRLGAKLPDEVANYIAARFTTQARALAGAVRRLQAESLAHAAPITLAMAEQALADLLDQPGRVVQLAEIEKVVCEEFGLESDSLQSDRKGRSVSHPRMLAMWLARKYTRSPLSEIGAYFGRRSHSTVISAQKKIDAWLSEGHSLEVHRSVQSLEDTLRRLEQQLKAG